VLKKIDYMPRKEVLRLNTTATIDKGGDGLRREEKGGALRRESAPLVQKRCGELLTASWIGLTDNKGRASSDSGEKKIFRCG